MIQKVRGIVLHHFAYGDSSLIVHVYSDLYGRLSVMAKGARGQKKNRRISLFHPLALLDLDLDYKESRELQLLREARPILPLHRLSGDPLKNTIALFLAEVFYRSLRENEPNHDLFEYLLSSVEYFDLMDQGTNLYHLYVLTHLTRFLGFRPIPPESDEPCWLNMETGLFTTGRPLSEDRFNPDLSSLFIALLKTTPDQLSHLKPSRDQKNAFIEHMLRFYGIHLQGMGSVRSFAILKAVFE